MPQTNLRPTTQPHLRHSQRNWRIACVDGRLTMQWEVTKFARRDVVAVVQPSHRRRWDVGSTFNLAGSSHGLFQTLNHFYMYCHSKN